MAKRIYKLHLEVTAPHTTGEREVADAINAALDEPPCDWEDWTVGPVTITGYVLVPDEELPNE